MAWFRRQQDTTSLFEPVLGTALVVQLRTSRRASPAALEQALLAEFDRVASVFSVFDPASEICRWRRGELDRSDISPELQMLLRDGHWWQVRSSGIFNPTVGVLTERWKRAAVEGIVPSADEMQQLADAISAPRYELRDQGVHRLGDCGQLNFNALAKGMAVDIASRRLYSGPGHHPSRMLVNVGGDLLHRGDGTQVVGIEHPLRAYDNEPPIARVAIANQGLATSGSARRGVRIDHRWFSHVIDPRTGWPVDHVASASVFAATAAEADVMATLLSVLPPQEGIALVESIVADPTNDVRGPVGCCVIDRSGTILTNASWDAQAV